MVNVTEIGEMGAYVTLLEYDNIPVTLFVGWLVFYLTTFETDSHRE